MREHWTVGIRHIPDVSRCGNPASDVRRPVPQPRRDALVLRGEHNSVSFARPPGSNTIKLTLP